MQKTTLWILAALTPVLAATPTRAETETKTIFIVRHAEKQKDGTRDPALTQEGTQRAEKLKEMMRSIKLDAVYATNYKRTQLTVQPSADQAKLKVNVMPAGDVAATAKAIKNGKQQRILVAGHSNTVPALLRELGAAAEDVPTISEKDYDNLFLVVISENKITTLQMHMPN